MQKRPKVPTVNYLYTVRVSEFTVRYFGKTGLILVFLEREKLRAYPEKEREDGVWPKPLTVKLALVRLKTHQPKSTQND